MQTLEEEEGAERDFDKSFGVGMKYERLRGPFSTVPNFTPQLISPNSGSKFCEVPKSNQSPAQFQKMHSINVNIKN